MKHSQYAKLVISHEKQISLSPVLSKTFGLKKDAQADDLMMSIASTNETEKSLRSDESIYN